MADGFADLLGAFTNLIQTSFPRVSFSGIVLRANGKLTVKRSFTWSLTRSQLFTDRLAKIDLTCEPMGITEEIIPLVAQEFELSDPSQLRPPKKTSYFCSREAPALNIFHVPVIE
jgi:hypothetical protein